MLGKQRPQLVIAQTPRATAIKLFKQLLEQLRPKAAIVVVDAGVGAMFRFVDARDVDAEEGVWKPRVSEAGRVGEEDGDEEGADGEGDAEAEVAEADVDVVGLDDVVAVAVPEEDVGLEGGGGGLRVEGSLGGVRQGTKCGFTVLFI